MTGYTSHGRYHYPPADGWPPGTILNGLKPFASKALRFYVSPEIPEWPLKYVTRRCHFREEIVLGMIVSSQALPGSNSVVFTGSSLYFIKGGEPIEVAYHNAFSLPVLCVDKHRVTLGEIDFVFLDGQIDLFIKLFRELAARYPGKMRPRITEEPKNRKPFIWEILAEADRACAEAFRDAPDGPNQSIIKISIRSVYGTKNLSGPSEMANAGGDAYCGVLKKHGIDFDWSERLD